MAQDTFAREVGMASLDNTAALDTRLTSVEQAVAASLKREIVAELPTEGISTTTIYMVPKSTVAPGQGYDEFMYINNQWEKIGDTEVSLNGYAKESWVEAKGYVDATYHDATKQDVISDLSTIRSGAALGATALQEHQSLAAYRTSAAQDTIDATKQDTISDLATIRSGAALGATALQEHQSLAAYRTSSAQDAIDATKANSADLATVATSGSYNDLSNKPTIPVVPTNVSAFTNDAGYLTSHQSLADYSTTAEMNSAISAHHDSTKQNTLTAGTNITIENDVISATGGGASYTAGTNITINENNVISAPNVVSTSGGTQKVTGIKLFRNGLCTQSSGNSNIGLKINSTSSGTTRETATATIINGDGNETFIKANASTSTRPCIYAYASNYDNIDLGDDEYAFNNIYSNVFTACDNGEAKYGNLSEAALIKCASQPLWTSDGQVNKVLATKDDISAIFSLSGTTLTITTT